MGIDTVDEGFAGVEEVIHGIMAEIACHLFSHPLPESYDRVQVGTIGRQRDEGEAQFCGGSLYALGSMPGVRHPR